MIYAYDQGIQYPVRDLYDKTIMLMSIAAAKDMYEKGLKQLEDFNTKYGDFMSPILKDMEWYDKNVTGKVRDTINNLYANGIDPLRSAEGRAAISLLIYSMPTGDIAKVRLSAETAKEYLKSFGDDTNPELEKFLGRDLSAWDTIGGNGIWNANRATKFLDINSWTHHLFDDMELSYDPEESKKYPGYKAYTKSKDTMHKILDINIDELLRTDLGKYYLNKVESEIPDSFTGNRRQAAINELKERIVNNNLENTQTKLEQDPYALARYLARLRGSGSGGGSRKPSGASYNWMNGLFLRGLTSAFGYNAQTGEEEALNNIVKDQVKFGQGLVTNEKYSGPWAAYKSKEIAYINQFTIYEDPIMFSGAVGKPALDKEGSVPFTRSDLQNLRTQQDIVTHTYGYTNSKMNTDYSKLEKMFASVPKIKNTDPNNPDNEIYDGIVMVPYHDVYTSFQDYENRGAVEQQWKVAIINKETGEKMGDFWYTIPNSREYTDDVPRLTEWKHDSLNNYYAPKTDKGEERGRAKSGINKNVRGWNERASWATSKMMGVNGQPFNLDVNYNMEGVAASPYRL